LRETTDECAYHGHRFGEHGTCVCGATPGEPTYTRIPPEDPEQVKARDRADLDRDFEQTKGGDPIAFLAEPDE
jgi:hypothetical protein